MVLFYFIFFFFLFFLCVNLMWMNEWRLGKLTTPMTEESNWMSQRRRSSAAFRMMCLESDRPSFFAMSEISISLIGWLGWRGREEWISLHFQGLRRWYQAKWREREWRGCFFEFARPKWRQSQTVKESTTSLRLLNEKQATCFFFFLINK